MPTNAEVLTALLIRERKAIIRRLTPMLDQASAEDICQVVYLKVLAIPPELQIQQPRAYLYRLAWHEAVSLNRRAASELRLRADVAELLGDASAPDTAQTAIAQLELRNAIAAVKRLPPPLPRIFAMSIGQGLSTRAIGKQLGLPQSTVARYLERALARAMRHIEKNESLRHLQA